jgi:PEP-CTERM motif
MLRKIVSVAVLAAAAGAVHAEATTWTFAYQGFFDETNEVFDPRIKISGSFTAEDLDHDGTIRVDELTQFKVWGDDFLTWDCQYTSGFHCYINEFTYRLDGKLDFNTENYYLDEFSSGAGNRIKTGDQAVDWGYGAFGRRDTVYRWTNQTVFTISPPPVPEPSTYAMLGAGMLLLAGWRGRHKS